MNEYTASNGVLIEDRGGSLHANGSLIIGVGSKFRVALAEFFRAEEDERLGRWRWPDDSDYLVYEDEDGDVTVINERKATVSSLVIQRDLSQRNPAHPVTQAARAYFDAHPEPKPEWYDAQVGEVWVLDIDHHHAQKEVAWQVATNGQFSRLGLALSKEDDRITSGRRIWPES